MNTVTEAMKSVWGIILDLGASVIAVIALVETWLHQQLTALGIQPPVQSLIMIAVAVILVLIAFRILRGLLRVLLVILLLLFAVHVGITFLRP